LAQFVVGVLNPDSEPQDDRHDTEDSDRGSEDPDGRLAGLTQVLGNFKTAWTIRQAAIHESCVNESMNPGRNQDDNESCVNEFL